MIIDVDSKDRTTGMSCPPLPFVTPAFMTSVKDLLKDSGKSIFSNNIVHVFKKVHYHAFFFLDIFVKDKVVKNIPPLLKSFLKSFLRSLTFSTLKASDLLLLK